MTATELPIHVSMHKEYHRVAAGHTAISVVLFPDKVELSVSSSLLDSDADGMTDLGKYLMLVGEALVQQSALSEPEPPESTRPRFNPQPVATARGGSKTDS